MRTCKHFKVEKSAEFYFIFTLLFRCCAIDNLTRYTCIVYIQSALTKSEINYALHIPVILIPQKHFSLNWAGRSLYSSRLCVFIQLFECACAQRSHVFAQLAFFIFKNNTTRIVTCALALRKTSVFVCSFSVNTDHCKPAVLRCLKSYKSSAFHSFCVKSFPSSSHSFNRVVKT